MSMKRLPALPAAFGDARVRFPVPQSAMNRWTAGVQAADDDERSIGIYDVIGQDYWTGEGVTAKRVAGALRSMGKGPVTVNVNSPGGDLFEGAAIYNMLREHPGEVTVRVLGLAASSASVIAMAGDRIEVAKAGFLMIHNSWVFAAGNRHEMRDIADQLEEFDQMIAGVYVDRTGGDAKAIAELMDKETWLSGSSAIEQGFADDLLTADTVTEKKTKARAERRLESALRASGISKSEAIALISEFKAGAGDPAGDGAGDPTSSTAALFAAIQSFTPNT